VQDHDDVREVVEKHRSYIMDETLAEELMVGGPVSDSHRVELPDGRAVHVGMSLAG